MLVCATESLQLLLVGQQLRSGTLALPKVAEAGVPDSLLHTFACDCALRILEKEAEGGWTISSHFRAALDVKRLWIEGKASDTELHHAREACRADTRPLFESRETYEQLIQAIIGSMVLLATELEAKDAFLLVLRRRSHLYQQLAADALTWMELEERELRWQALHLASLIDLFVAQRGRLFRLLSTRTTQLSSRVIRAQEALEESLFSEI